MILVPQFTQSISVGGVALPSTPQFFIFVRDWLAWESVAPHVHAALGVVSFWCRS